MDAGETDRGETDRGEMDTGDMGTRVHDNQERGRFELIADGEVAGFATYRRDGDVVTIPHTEIRPELAGRGLGTILVRGTLDMVRASGGRVVPRCPFVRDFIADHPDEYLALVPEDRRSGMSLPAS